ncbi:RDD family protein [Bacillus sp. CRN 9]|nr:RDD family protein [Bacillus sp. CRN 9]
MSLIYFIILPITAIQGTVGKYVLGMKITNKEGNRVSLIQSFIRFISMALSTITLFIGYLLIAFTSKKQGLHDMISRTFVVQR